MFYDELFSKIDDTIFEKLYFSEHVRPNDPADVLIRLKILKSNFDLSDKELFEEQYFITAYQRALGIKNLDEDYILIRTFYQFIKVVTKYFMSHVDPFYETVFQNFTIKSCDRCFLKILLLLTKVLEYIKKVAYTQ